MRAVCARCIRDAGFAEFWRGSVRSDRSGDRFSLIRVFAARAGRGRMRMQVRLARLLRRRLRSTDEAGWMDRQNIGVVLPATPTRGAWKVAEDVCQHFSARA